MTKKGKGKKVLSLALTLVMVLTMLPAFTAGLFNLAKAAAVKSAGTTMGDVTFIVPEAIYLYPNGTSWRDSTSTPFQFYLNNNADGTITKNTTDTTGNIFWRYNTASNASLSWRFVDGSFNTLSGGSVTVNASTGLGTSKNISVTDGSSPSLAASTTGCWLEWCVSYTDTVDNQAKKAYAYTYVYKPYVVPVGAFVRARCDYGTDSFAQQVTWITGVHSIVPQGSDQTHDGNYYPNYKGEFGLSGFMTTGSKAYAGGTQVNAANTTSTQNQNWSASYSGASRMKLAFLNWGTNQTVNFNDTNGHDDSNATDWGNSSGNTFNVLSFDYWYKHSSSSDRNSQAYVYATPYGVISIDTSRFTDLKNIPNLGIGLMATDNEHTDNGNWYIADYTTDSDFSSPKMSYNDSYSQSGSSNRETYYNDYGYKIARIGANKWDDWSGDGDDEGVKYAGAWPRTLLSTSTSAETKTYAMKGLFATNDGSDYSFAGAIVRLDANQYNKTNLRAAVQRATSKMAALGVNGAFTSCYFDADSSNGTWTTLVNAYKAAVLALTKVDGTITNPDTLANDLNNALDGLKTKVNYDGNGGTLNGVSPSYVVIGTNQSVQFQPDTYLGSSYTGTRTGYSLKSTDKRWSTDPNAANGSSAVTVGYNDTVYAIWTPNTYSVGFNANGAAGSMSSQSFQYDTASALTQNEYNAGYTITFDGNGTGSTVDEASLTAARDFLRWQGQDLINEAGPYIGSSSGTGETNIIEWPISGAFLENDRYILEYDAYGSGTLQNFFYGDNGYRGVKNAVCSNGTTSTRSDGCVVVNLTSQSQHYKVEYTIGISGNESVNKKILFRAYQNCDAHISNVRVYREFSNGQTVKNLTTGNSYELTAVWGGVQPITLPGATRNGYQFMGWYNEKSGTVRYGGAGDSYTPGSSMTMYAQWQVASYTITYVEGLNGETTSQQRYTFNPGNSASSLKTGAAPTGYTFTGWRVGTHTGNWRDGALLDGGASTQNVWGDATLTAEYAPMSYVTEISVGTGGHFLTDPPATVEHDGVYIFSVSLDSGYDTETPTIFSENCHYELTGSGSSYTVKIKDVTGNVTLRVNPQPTKFRVNVSTTPGVSLLTESADLETTYNGTVTFTVELQDGYRDLAAKIGATALSPKSEDGSAYTFEVKNVKSVVTVDVTAERISYVAAFTSTSDCATFGLSSPQTVYSGENLEFTFTMNEGYTQTEPTVTATNGVAVEKISDDAGVYTYQLKNVQANTTVTVTGELNKYAVHVNTDAGLEPIANASVSHGSDYTLTLTLKPAYNKTAPTATANGAEIALTKVSDTVYTHTFTNVTGDITVSAASTLNTYDVTITGDAGCTVSDAAFNGVSHGNTVTFTVTLKEGYTGTEPVVKNGEEPIAYASKNGNAYTYTVEVTSDLALTVETKLNQYTVRFVLPSGEELYTAEVSHGVTPTYGGEVIETVSDSEKHYAFTNVWTPAIVPATQNAVYTAVVEGNPHTWDEGEVTTPPTCTEAGEKTYTCTVCGRTYTEPVEAKGHAYGAWTPNGAGGHIRYCANDPTHQETAPHAFDEGVRSTGFSCTDGGTITYTCRDCGYQRIDYVPSGAYHQFGEWVTVKRGNDQHYELQRRTCVACGAIQEQSVPFNGSPDQADPNVNGNLLKNRFNFWEWLLSIFHRIANIFKGMKF